MTENNSTFLRELRSDLEQVAVGQAPQPRSRRTALMLSAAAAVVALGVVGSLALQPDDTQTVATSPDQESPLEEPEATTSHEIIEAATGNRKKRKSNSKPAATQKRSKQTKLD